MIKFQIDRTELISLKSRASLEDLSCSKVALNYKEEGFQINFSKAYDAILGNPEGNTFTVSKLSRHVVSRFTSSRLRP